MSKSGFDELAEIFGSTEAEGERKKAQEKPPKPKDRGSSTSSPAPTLKKEAGNGEEGARQENILGSEQQKHPVADSLRQEIRLILGISNKDLKWHEKEYELFRLLKEALAKIGCFYHTSEDDLLFFRLEDHNLYDIRETAFEHYLIWLTDNPRKVKNEWLPKLQARVRFEAREVTTHFLAYNDSADLNTIAINTFDGFMMRRKREGTWEQVFNGTERVLFRTPPDFLTPWRPDFDHGGTGKDLEWLCSLGHFSDDGPLSVDDQQRLLRAWILHLFVPALNPVHPVPLLEGVTGSGKTVLGECLGRWVTGLQFEVTGLPGRNPDEALTIALHKRPLVVIDNVDSPSHWMEDFLCRVATGVRMSTRRLYTNNDEVHFTPRAGVIITSREPHFRREDVARRLIPIKFQEISDEHRRTETKLRAEVDARRGRIWADVLASLERLQDAWPTLKDTLKSSHSLGDFAVFGGLVAAAHPEDSDPKQWEAVMVRLKQAQHRFTTEEDPLAEVLKVALQQSKGTLPQQPVSDLFGELGRLATNRGLPWPYKNPGALTRALKGKRLALEQALNARIVLSDNHRGGVSHVAITEVPDGDLADTPSSPYEVG